VAAHCSSQKDFRDNHQIKNFLSDKLPADKSKRKQSRALDEHKKVVTEQDPKGAHPRGTWKGKAQLHMVVELPVSKRQEMMQTRQEGTIQREAFCVHAHVHTHTQPTMHSLLCNLSRTFM
jgi:hypothetical protein